MEIDVVALLRDHPELTLFLVIGVGYLVGKIGGWGIRLGSSIGVLFMGLVAGHFGFTISPIVGTLGFIFFIYSVGYQAGPHFFSTFRTLDRDNVIKGCHALPANYPDDLLKRKVSFIRLVL